uniref:Uncharacterized protein n=1 Tax=Zea mays TaxID=4577 RepID=A0A804PID6_MAIZE
MSVSVRIPTAILAGIVALPPPYEPPPRRRPHYRQAPAHHKPRTPQPSSATEPPFSPVAPHPRKRSTPTATVNPVDTAAAYIRQTTKRVERLKERKRELVASARASSSSHGSRSRSSSVGAAEVEVQHLRSGLHAILVITSAPPSEGRRSTALCTPWRRPTARFRTRTSPSSAQGPSTPSTR